MISKELLSEVLGRDVDKVKGIEANKMSTYNDGDLCPVCLMLTWDYDISAPTKRIVPYSLASSLGNNGCAYKIQAIDIEFGYIITEWKH